MRKIVESEVDRHLCEQMGEAFERRMTAILPDGADFGERERIALDAANELVRAHLESWLQRMANAQPEHLILRGASYRRHARGRVAYHSLCGPLEVDRWTYRPVGVRNGPTQVVLELAAGLVEGATPQLALCIAQGYAKAPMRSVEQDLQAAYRRPPSRCSLERIALAIGTKVKAVAPRLESQLRAQESVPEQAVAINLGLDRTSIPMAEDTRAIGSERRRDRRRGRVLQYRMGYVGTFTLTDAEGNSLLTRRYAAPAHADPSSIVQRLMSDLRRARQLKPELRIGVVQDAAPELWRLMRDALRAELKVPPWAVRWRETIDRYHLMQHLAEGLELLVPDQRARHKKLHQWRELLDRTDRAIVTIDRWFQRTALRRDLWFKMLEAVGRYIAIHRRFRYASAKKQGFHQGSGVTEGACKSLITSRTKRSGQRWRPRGIGAVLALRSLLESDRLPSFWPLFAQRYVSVPLAA